MRDKLVAHLVTSRNGAHQNKRHMPCFSRSALCVTYCAFLGCNTRYKKVVLRQYSIGPLSPLSSPLPSYNINRICRWRGGGVGASACSTNGSLATGHPWKPSPLPSWVSMHPAGMVLFQQRMVLRHQCIVSSPLLHDGANTRKFKKRWTKDKRIPKIPNQNTKGGQHSCPKLHPCMR